MPNLIKSIPLGTTLNYPISGVILLLAVSAMWVSTTFAGSRDIEPLTIYYFERVPYYSTAEDGTAQGLIVERVRLVFAKAGIPVHWEPLPSKRHMLYLQNNYGRFATTGWYKTEERQKFAKYSEPIYQNKTRIALARMDNRRLTSGLPLATVLSDPGLTLLLKSGYSYGTYIDEAIAKHSPNKKEITADSLSMIKLIHDRRYDYFFTSEEEAETLIPTAGYRRGDFQFIHFSDTPAGLKRYILYSNNVDDTLIDTVDAAIREHLQN